MKELPEDDADRIDHEASHPVMLESRILLFPALPSEMPTPGWLLLCLKSCSCQLAGPITTELRKTSTWIPTPRFL